MTTLTDFLLARIAEDESAAGRAASHPNAWGVLANDNYGNLLVQPTRVLAECAAKRRIVEEYGLCGYNAERAGGLQTAMRAHAAVYADHPDYRPEWTP